MTENYFFRVEHGLLKSAAFKELNGSAVKVYLIIGLYSNFGTGWAYPSIRTIAQQAGLSRQTVLDAIAKLCRCGVLMARKTTGQVTAYRIVRQAPPPPRGATPKRPANRSRSLPPAVPEFLEDPRETGPESLDQPPAPGPEFLEVVARFLDAGGPKNGPEREQRTRETINSMPIPGTPFRVTADGRLLVAVDLQELLTDQGLPPKISEKIVRQKDPESVAKVLLNALFLQSQGKLQNGPGYIRAGIEEGYDLLPQVAQRLEARRRELASRLAEQQSRRDQLRQQVARAAEQAAIDAVLATLDPDELDDLVDQAVQLLPEPMVRRNRTISNPFVRTKVYELARGDTTTN